jgi:hypothetical protein
MKSKILKWMSALALVASLNFVETTQAQTRVSISLFYSTLAPYGEWIHYRDYGLCWRPTVVGVGWRPYTHGRWVWTDYGWTWVSYYEWGWAPFHYGRWTYDDYYGWIWVPDDVWGPAWVDWRFSDTYIGWAPLPPGARYQVGIGVSFGRYTIPHFGWSFTYCSGFLAPNLVLLPVHRNAVVIRTTRVIHGIGYRDNRVYNHGPRVDFVEGKTKVRVRKSVIVEERKFGEGRRSRLEGDRLFMYRPDISRTGGGSERKEIERPRRSSVREFNRGEFRKETQENVTRKNEREPREFRPADRERRSAPDWRRQGERKESPKGWVGSDRRNSQPTERRNPRR